MKIKLNGVRRINITGEYIRLDALLKLSSLASTGGEAKVYIQGGDVFVDDELCVQRGRKVAPGSVVRFRNDSLIVAGRRPASG